MKSSSKTRIRVLAVNPTISSRTARTFLEELANTWDDAPGLERFERKFREVYREQIPWETVNGWARIAEELDYDRLGDDEKLRKYWLMPLRDAVRTVWCLPDLRSKRLAVCSIVAKLLYPSEPRFHPEPLHDPRVFSLESFGEASNLERILEELMSERSHHLACKCLNRGCPSPFFFATRQAQKFCSEPCAAPAQREAKRNWWKEHGKKWRSQRAAKPKRRQTKAGQKQRDTRKRAQSNP